MYENLRNKDILNYKREGIEQFFFTKINIMDSYLENYS